MTLAFRAKAILTSLLASVALLSLQGCAVVSGGSTTTTPPTNTATIPGAPTGLQAAAGNAQVALTWMAPTGATSYHLKRGTTSGGPYIAVSAPTVTNFTDTALTNGRY